MCTFGYTGVNCQIPINYCDSSPCANGGTCISAGPGQGFVCSCAAGWTGLTCQTSAFKNFLFLLNCLLN